jgi:hypothetical protein
LLAGEGERPLDEDYLDEIAAAFGQVVDSKSPYTAGHSGRVALYTDMLAQELGFIARAAALAETRCLVARCRQAGSE